MRALALIALLIPLTAEAGMLGGGNGLVRARTSPVAARYVPRVGQAFVGERGEPVTVTRASTKNCLVNGVWTSAAVNTACIGDAGLSVEGSRTNILLASETIPTGVTVGTTPWLTNATDAVTTTADQALSPANTMTADLVVVPAAANAMLKQRITTIAETTYTLSAWVWTDSGTKSFRLWRNNTAAWETASVSPTLTATTTPHRFSLTFTTLAGETASNIGFGGESKTGFAPTAGNYFVWGWQLEAGPTASSYIATTTTPVTRAADVVSAGHGIAGGDWCVRWQGSVADWAPAVPAGFWQLGTSGAANIARAYVNAGVVYFIVYDAAGAQRTVTANHSFSAGSEHSITACSGATGAMSLLVDGAAGSAPAGAGTGVISTMPAAMLIGSYAAARELNGPTLSLTTCNTSVASECQ